MTQKSTKESTLLDMPKTPNLPAPSNVLVPACGYLNQRMPVQIALTTWQGEPEITGEIVLRHIELPKSTPKTRVEGMLIFIGTIPVNHRISFAVTHEPGKPVQIKSEPIKFDMPENCTGSIQGIQLVLLPYVGEEDSEAILTYMRLISILMNADIIIQGKQGQSYNLIGTVPMSVVETIPLGPQDNLKPYGIKTS